MSKYNNQFKLESAEKEQIERVLSKEFHGASSRNALQKRQELEALMGRLREQEGIFTLNVRDVDLIEESVRAQIHTLSQENLSGSPEVARANKGRIMELEQLLGTLHNQKVWYGQVHHTGVPLAGG